ncbi:MAG: rod shape-determining protein MreC [Bacillota bacterium]
MRFWRDRRFVGSLLISLCLITLMAATRAPDRAPGRLEHLWLELLAPVEGILTEVSRRTGGWMGDLIRFRIIVRENQQMRSQLAELDALESRLALLERENRRLRNLLALSEAVQVEVGVARVLARHPSNWTRQLTLDRGSGHGVRTGDVVVTPSGLVGRVVSTTANTARVMLITSPESGLGVESVSSGDAGVAVGQVAQGDLLRVSFFDPAAEVFEGDMLVTSGLGEAIPGGIPLGEVVRVTTEEMGLLREVWVRPAADLNHLHEVMVVRLPGRQGLDWPGIGDEDTVER